jgi:hypothetical protein
MMLSRLALLGLLAVCACSSTPRARGGYRPGALGASEQWHEEVSYGFTSENPIRIGGGPQGEYIFFEVLRGPEGQPVAWRQVGRCCELELSPGHVEGLDVYEVIYPGLEEPVILYLDVHHSEPVFAPRGFTLFVDEGMNEGQQEAPLPRSPEIIEL